MQTSPAGNSPDTKPEPAIKQLLPFALMTIHTLSEAAAKGDQGAIEALYKVATMAASSLNSLSMEMKKAYAADAQLWPVNLSWVKSWNAAEITRVPEDLALGSNRKSVVDLEAVFKISTRHKLIGSLLVAFVEYCRRLRVRRLEVTSSGRQLSELSEKETQVLRSAYHDVHSQIVEVAKFLKITWPDWRQTDTDSENKMVFRYAQLAAALPPLLVDRQSRLQWFDLAMELIEELTGGKYERPEFELSDLSSIGADAGGGKFKAGIRQGVLAGFDAVIRTSDLAAFVKV